LNRFGLRLSDVKLEKGDGSLGEANVFCSLYHLSTTVRVRLDAVEIACYDTVRFNQQQFVDIARSSLEAVSRTLTNNPYKTYAVTANLHGAVEGMTTQDFLARTAGKGPTNLGPLLASGAVFYYGAEAERLTSFLNVDLSGAKAGAVYVRTHIVFDAAKASLNDLPTLTENYLRTAFESLELDWPVLPPT